MRIAQRDGLTAARIVATPTAIQIFIFTALSACHKYHTVSSLRHEFSVRRVATANYAKKRQNAVIILQ
jgi:hypothetical protein